MRMVCPAAIKPSMVRREKIWLRSMVGLRPRSVDEVVVEEGSGVACREEDEEEEEGEGGRGKQRCRGVNEGGVNEWVQNSSLSRAGRLCSGDGNSEQRTADCGLRTAHCGKWPSLFRAAHGSQKSGKGRPASRVSRPARSGPTSYLDMQHAHSHPFDVSRLTLTMNHARGGSVWPA